MFSIHSHRRLHRVRVNSTLLNRTCTPISSVDQQMYPAAYSLFFIVSLPANCLSLYVAWRLTMKGNSVAVYLISLSISDLLYTITLPVWIEMALKRRVADGLCSTLYLIMYNSFYVGSGLLCCISVDRYLAVVYPLRFHWVREVNTTLAVNTAVWILEISVHVLLLHHMGALESFSYLCHQQIPMPHKDATVALIRVVLSFLVPVIIMTFCYQQIMWSLKQSTSILAGERRKVGLLLLFLLLAYIVSFVPYQTVMFLRAVMEPETCSWAMKFIDPYMVTVAMTTLNCTLDPIIYCLINDSAKTEIKKVVKKGRNTFIFRKLLTRPSGIEATS